MTFRTTVRAIVSLMLTVLICAGNLVGTRSARAQSLVLRTPYLTYAAIPDMKTCRGWSYLSAAYQTQAVYWSAVGVDDASIRTVLYLSENVKHAACSETPASPVVTDAVELWFEAMEWLREKFEGAAGIQDKELVAQYQAHLQGREYVPTFYKSSAAFLGSVNHRNGGNDVQSIAAFLDGEVDAINLFGEVCSDIPVGAVAPTTWDQFNVGEGSESGCGGGGGSGQSGSGGSGGTVTSQGGIDPWLPGQAPSTPGCFMDNGGNDECGSPYASGAGNWGALGGNSGEGLIGDNGRVAVLGVGALVATVAMAGVSVPLFVPAAIAIIVFEDGLADLVDGTPDNPFGPYLCPILGPQNSTVSQPIYINGSYGRLSQVDVLESCNDNCFAEDNCVGINNGISCNYQPVAANGKILQECVDIIHEHNPFLDDWVIKKELCSQVTCPDGSFSSASPLGYCGCTDNSGGSVSGGKLDRTCWAAICQDPFILP